MRVCKSQNPAQASHLPLEVVPLVEGEDVLVLDQERLSWLVSLGAVGLLFENENGSM